MNTHLSMMTAQQQANENTRLVATVYRLAMRACHGCGSCFGDLWRCDECGAHGLDRAAVLHAPGCVLRGYSADELRALEGFEIREGETL